MTVEWTPDRNVKFDNRQVALLAAAIVGGTSNEYTTEREFAEETIQRARQFFNWLEGIEQDRRR